MTQTKGFVGFDSRQGLTVNPRVGVLLAGCLYLLWGYFLFSPHLQKLSNYRLLYLFNNGAAALGTFLLSRRWLAGWTPSVMAGLFYGFSPFALSFLGFHPIAGLTFAAVPWLLLPAVYWKQGQQPNLFRFFGRAVLSVLPFAFIIGFFWVFSQHWAGPLFLLPSKTALTVQDFKGLVLPLSMTGRPIILGVYHAGLLTAVMGLFVFLSAQRVSALIPPIVGLVLAFVEPVCLVSQVIWVSLPMIFLAILTGLGIQAMLLSGKADAKWILICSIVGLLLGGVCFAASTIPMAGAFRTPALFYLASAACFGMLFAVVRKGQRWLFLRWLILTTLLLSDCFLCGQWLIQKLL
jgi:hypothetical protein